MILNYKTKFFLLTFLLITLPFSIYAKKAPESFANLAEILSPSVVNISTTTIIEDRKNNLPVFPPGSPPRRISGFPQPASGPGPGFPVR